MEHSRALRTNHPEPLNGGRVEPAELAVRIVSPAYIWRTLRSRRLAIILLIAVTVLAVLGALLPQQERIGPVAFAQWAQANPTLAAFSAALNLDSLYSAWWFLSLLALLYANTLACTIPQLRSAASLTLRRSKHFAVGRREAGYELDLQIGARDALTSAQGLLRKGGYRIVTLDNGLVARKGALSIWGSPIFHLGLIVIFTGAAIGGLLRFSGYLEVGEGQGFLDQQGAYLQHSQGPLFDRKLSLGPITPIDVGHHGFAVRLDGFNPVASGWGRGVQSDVVSEVTILEDGQEVSRGTIRINEPLEHRGLKIYPAATFGLAPVFELELPDGSLNSGMVNLAPKGAGFYENTLYLPGTIYRMTVSAREGDPGVEIEVLQRQQSLYQGRLDPGETAQIGFAKLKFDRVRRWTGLRVVAEPGTIVLYLGFGLALLGLALSFLVVRREVWVEVVERPEGRLLRIGGRAPRLKALFEAELEELAEKLRSSWG